MITRSKAKRAPRALDGEKKDRGVKRQAIVAMESKATKEAKLESSPGSTLKKSTKKGPTLDKPAEKGHTLEKPAEKDSPLEKPADKGTPDKLADKNNTPKKSSSKRKSHGRMSSAAIRPRRKEEKALYLRDLTVIYAPSENQKPSRCVECVNFHKEDIFGHGGENLNHGFQLSHCTYLVPLWTDQKELAKVTGFEIVASPVEDASRPNLYAGLPGMYVYLIPTFDPKIEDRIIGVQLYRSRNFNPPKFGWSHTTVNINQGRGGDNLYLQWDLGGDHDVAGHKFRFQFWKR